MSLSLDAIESILQQVSFPGTTFLLRGDASGLPYLQVEVKGRCNVSAAPMTWRGRKWRLSYHMTKSEIVQTAFLAVLTASEHEVREQFRYRGAAIFGPHFDVERLAAFAADERIDERPKA